MSKIQVSGLVNSLREKTTIYSPIIESITNSVYAIAKTKRNDGYIKIKMIRSNQNTIDDSKPDVIGFEIEDNGIGFNEENKNSFDTAFSDLKREYGGKGGWSFHISKIF
jgi:signal transduction histidine kinase